MKCAEVKLMWTKPKYSVLYYVFYFRVGYSRVVSSLVRNTTEKNLKYLVPNQSIPCVALCQLPGPGFLKEVYPLGRVFAMIMYSERAVSSLGH